MLDYLKSHSADDTGIIMKVILVVLYLLLTEFLPDILALDSSFLATYILDDETDDDTERSSGRKTILKTSDANNEGRCNI